MKLSRVLIALAIVATIGFAGCMTVQDHRNNLSSTQDREMTVGNVQREIHKNMSGAEVAEVLGSPNVVTKDEGDNETWVYDKIATEVSYSSSQNAMFLILGGVANQSGAASVTQKTLTVVIKFDENKKVKSFSYHSSTF